MDTQEQLVRTPLLVQRAPAEGQLVKPVQIPAHHHQTAFAIIKQVFVTAVKDLVELTVL